mmetsp:Transcript_41047/g.108673  ORF Transcript_41047/g.108673 Transcript_41047/m.108673 type:complete len:241 (+) Transcript_41047:301-1023(+)
MCGGTPRGLGSILWRRHRALHFCAGKEFELHLGARQRSDDAPHSVLPSLEVCPDWSRYFLQQEASRVDEAHGLYGVDIHLDNVVRRCACNEEPASKLFSQGTHEWCRVARVSKAPSKVSQGWSRFRVDLHCLEGLTDANLRERLKELQHQPPGGTPPCILYFERASIFSVFTFQHTVGNRAETKRSAKPPQQRRVQPHCEAAQEATRSIPALASSRHCGLELLVQETDDDVPPQTLQAEV